MKSLAVVLILVGLTSFLGCSDGAGGKKMISGQVVFQGKPLDQGTISFLAEGTPAPAAEALITDGKYLIPADQGLLPGKYAVRIRSTEEFRITPEEYAAGKTAPPAKERIPAKYNAQSQETVEVKTGATNAFDYRID